MRTNNVCQCCCGCSSSQPPNPRSIYWQRLQLPLPCDLSPSSAVAPNVYLSHRACATLACRAISANPSQCVEEMLHHFSRTMLLIVAYAQPARTSPASTLDSDQPLLTGCRHYPNGADRHCLLARVRAVALQREGWVELWQTKQAPR